MHRASYPTMCAAAMPILRALDPDGPGSIGLEHFLQLAAACSAPRLGDAEEPAGGSGDRGYSEGDGEGGYGEGGYGEGGYGGYGEGGASEAGGEGQAPRQDEDGDPKVLEFIR